VGLLLVTSFSSALVRLWRIQGTFQKWLYLDCGNIRPEQISLAYLVENLLALWN